MLTFNSIVDHLNRGVYEVILCTKETFNSIVDHLWTAIFSDHIPMYRSFNSIVDHPSFSLFSTQPFLLFTFNSIVDHHIGEYYPVPYAGYLFIFQFYSRSSSILCLPFAFTHSITFNSIVDHRCLSLAQEPPIPTLTFNSIVDHLTYIYFSDTI